MDWFIEQQEKKKCGNCYQEREFTVKYVHQEIVLGFCALVAVIMWLIVKVLG